MDNDDEKDRVIMQLRAELEALKAAKSSSPDVERSLLRSSSLIPSDLHPKVITDPVHTTITFHPLVIRVLDTVYVQRLRALKQLGLTYLVYPGASHNRFEHSLGVAHLAGEMLRELQMKQPELGISNHDVHLVQIAGLCHDLGHGPFSHLFDDVVLRDSTVPQRKHEVRSQLLFDALVRDYHLQDVISDEDREFVKELIHPPEEIKCRGPEKYFLYQVVANKESGVDVDKFDYVARDLHGLGILGSFTHHRLLRTIRVNYHPPTGRMKLCYYENEAENLYKLFNTRHELHVAAYQHKITTVLDVMVSEALHEVDLVLEENQGDESLTSTFPFKGSIRKSVEDMGEFVKLTDTIFDTILWSSHPKLARARELCKAVQDRTLFKFVANLKFKNDRKTHLEDALKRTMRGEIVAEMERIQDLPLADDGEEARITADDLVIETNKFTFGQKGDVDPVGLVDFFFKDDPRACRQLPQEAMSRVSHPKHFRDEVTRVYCRRRERWFVETARLCVHAWSARPEALFTLSRGLGSQTPNKKGREERERKANYALTSAKNMPFSPLKNTLSLTPSRAHSPPVTPQTKRRKQSL